MNKFFKSWTGKIITLNMIVFSIMFVCNYLQTKTWIFTSEILRQFGAVHPQDSSWYSVASMMFLHGSIIHIVANSISLYTIGSVLEKHAKYWFLPVYFFAGIVSGITVYIYGSDWTVGASGAICGVWAMLVVYNMKFKRSASMVIANIIDLSLLVYISSLPNISAWAHFSGFMIGLIFGLVYFNYFYVDEEKKQMLLQLKAIEEDKQKREKMDRELQEQFNRLILDK